MGLPRLICAFHNIQKQILREGNLFLVKKFKYLTICFFSSVSFEVLAPTFVCLKMSSTMEVTKTVGGCRARVGQSEENHQWREGWGAENISLTIYFWVLLEWGDVCKRRIYIIKIPHTGPKLNMSKCDHN